jgi:hypothetical protein
VPQNQTPKKLQTQYFFIVALRDNEEHFYDHLKTHLSYELQLYSQFYYRKNLHKGNTKTKVDMMLKQIYTKNGLPTWQIHSKIAK